MPKIEIYTSAYCPYCVRAKALLDSKNVEYKELRIDLDPSLPTKMVELTGGKKTVPQIFINDQYIGDCDYLYSMNKKGELDKLLQ